MTQLSILFISIFLRTAPNAAIENESTYFLKIEQNGVIREINPGENKLTLKKTDFEMTFVLNKYSIGTNNIFKFAVYDKKEIFNNVTAGTKIASIRSFASGTSLAGYRDKPYMELVVCDYGNHSIYYEDEPDNRADLVGENSDGSFKLSWPISSILYIKTMNSEKKQFALSEIPFKVLYCVAIFDRNTNGILDEGEFATIEIRFE